MIKIAYLNTGPQGNDYTSVEFEDMQGNVYRLGNNKFFDRNGIRREHKDYLKTFFDSIKDNPLFSQYCIEINNDQQIINMKEMPMLTANLASFYTKYTKCDNFALATQKFGRFVKDKLEYMNFEQKGLFQKYIHSNQYAKGLPEKQKLILQQLIVQNQKVSVLELNQHWRMAIGLGNASVYNNGFTFHPVFGIPYIPGQNVKGILRNYIINEYFYEINKLPTKILRDDKISSKKEYLAEQDPVFCHYFGCSEKNYDNTARKGVITFLDSFPINDFKIEPDIMNPHYADYYKEGSTIAPHDALSPVPIVFLTIKDAAFKFNFYMSNKENIKSNEFEFSLVENNEPVDYTYDNYKHANTFFKQDQEIATLIHATLKEALEISGIGAKTAVGYGRFI